MPEDEGQGSVETAMGRVTFPVTRNSGGRMTIPRGAVVTFPDGSVMGTVVHEVPLNGFSPSNVKVSTSEGVVQLSRSVEVQPLHQMPEPKRAIDRLLEDEDLL